MKTCNDERFPQVLNVIMEWFKTTQARKEENRMTHVIGVNNFISTNL
jgi:hypothetical protein